MDIIASEYGYTLEVIRSHTRRELFELITAMNNRKSGYKNESESVKVEVTEDALAKIEKAQKQRMGGR